MPRVYKRRLGSYTCGNYSEEKLNLCLAAIRSWHFTQRKGAIEFNIPRRTIINTFKGKHVNKPRQPPIFSAEEETFVRC
jgi:hypothetical protein